MDRRNLTRAAPPAAKHSAQAQTQAAPGPCTTVGDIRRILEKYDDRTPIVQHASAYSSGYDSVNAEAFQVKRINRNEPERTEFSEYVEAETAGQRALVWDQFL